MTTRDAKNFRRLGIAALAALLLSSCSAVSSGSDDDRPVVLTTFTVLSDIAQNVAGDHLRVESITKAGGPKFTATSRRPETFGGRAKPI